MFRVSTTLIIRSTQNCNYSLRYWSYFLCSYRPPRWPSLATLNGVAAQKLWSVYNSASSLYMFRVSTTLIIRSTQNCNYSLRYWSYFLCSYLPPRWPSLATLNGVAAQKLWSVYITLQVHTTCFVFQTHPSSGVHRTVTTASGTVQLPPYSLATLEQGRCTKYITSTGGCSYSSVYSWWWVWLTPRTCRVNLQNNK